MCPIAAPLASLRVPVAMAAAGGMQAVGRLFATPASFVSAPVTATTSAGPFAGQQRGEHSAQLARLGLQSAARAVTNAQGTTRCCLMSSPLAIFFFFPFYVVGHLLWQVMMAWKKNLSLKINILH